MSALSIQDKTLRDQVNHTKARVGALARARKAGDPDLAKARRDLRAAKLEEYVSRIVAEAPPLTEDQKHRIVSLLGAAA